MAPHRTPLALAAALAAALVAAPAGPARAEPGAPTAKQEAAEHFQRGVRSSRDGDHQAALVEFRRAYDLVPDYRVLYNLGQTSREIKDHAGALASFERYLAEGKGAVGPKRRREVEAAIAQLRAKVAELRVEVGVEGADVSVDDAPVGVTPLPRPLTVNAGLRKVSAQRAGYLPAYRFVELAGADRVTVNLELSPLPTAALAEPAPAPAAAPPRPAAPPALRLRREPSARPWVALAATGALAATAGALGVQALRSQAALEDTLRERTSTDEVRDARAKARTWAFAADVAGGVAVAGAVTTLVLFLVERPARAGATEPRVGFDPGGLRVAF